MAQSSPPLARRPGGAAGFSLLEVLIAFMIAGLALAAVSAALVSGTSSLRFSAHVTEAVSRARSHLESAARIIQPGEQSGDDGGGFAWRTETRAVNATGSPDGGVALVLYRVSVDISWRLDGGQRHVRLDTMRLAAGGPRS